MTELIRLELPASTEISRDKRAIFKMFAQSMLNRLAVGELRYGSGSKKKKYLTRLRKELDAYAASGNAEQLFNIANYCVLEWIFPEHPNHHLDTTVESVTRKDK